MKTSKKQLTIKEIEKILKNVQNINKYLSNKIEKTKIKKLEKELT